LAEGLFRQKRHSAAALLILLLASFFQFHLAARDNRFLPDEAFFMTFARGAAVKGAWLLPGPLDKPPLSIYLSALSMVLGAVTADADGVLQLDAHVGEFAAMLPNALLALLLTALMMRLAGRLYSSAWAAVFAGLLTVASPYWLAYGASAFTDMSLLFCSALALYCALTRRWAGAGLALGLAFWCKQQAVFIALLVMLLLLAGGGRRRDWLGLGLPLVIGGAALLIWDMARPETSIFVQAAANNAPDNWLAAPSLWVERLVRWLGLGLGLLGPPPVTGVLLLGAAFASFRRAGAGWRMTSIERALLIYIAGTIAVFAILQFNFYGRYLLLILPPLIMLAAGRLARLPEAAARGRGLRFGFVMLLLASAIWSVNRGGSLGAARRVNDGLDHLAAHLNAKPIATVIYDPWLGWELGYYLGPWHDKRRVHYPTTAALVDGALALDEAGDRYFIAPSDQAHEQWLAALRRAGFGVGVDYERNRFIVYRLRPPDD